MAYYDQSYFFFWFAIATISSLHVLMYPAADLETESAEDPPRPGVQYSS